MPYWQQSEKELVRIAMRNFPAEFGLRAFPGRRFFIHEGASFVSEGVVLLYVFDKEYGAFSKGTVNELSREVVD